MKMMKLAVTQHRDVEAKLETWKESDDVTRAVAAEGVAAVESVAADGDAGDDVNWIVAFAPQAPVDVLRFGA